VTEISRDEVAAAMKEQRDHTQIMAKEARKMHDMILGGGIDGDGLEIPEVNIGLLAEMFESDVDSLDEMLKAWGVNGE